MKNSIKKKTIILFVTFIIADLLLSLCAYNYANIKTFVSQSVHKTYIDLNESGTKAAAVTFFGLSKATSAAQPEFETINIDFNKSFLYLIREKKTNEILFMGVVNNPEEWKGTTCTMEN